MWKRNDGTRNRAERKGNLNLILSDFFVFPERKGEGNRLLLQRRKEENNGNRETDYELVLLLSNGNLFQFI